MNPIKKTILLTQALWAKHTVRLAPEPPGRRSGVVLPSSPIAEAAAEPLRLVAVGDSLVAGSGVDNQSDALTPRIAQKICRELGIDYADVAHAELVADFWASDGFHPGAPGYEQASGLVVNAMSFLPSLTATIH